MRPQTTWCIVLVVSVGLLFGATAGAAPNVPAPTEAEPVIELEAAGTGRANALAYSPDGQMLAVGTASGLVLYDAHTLAELRFIPSEGGVRGLDFSPDGRLLATGGYASDVKLWRVADGTLERRLIGHTSWVRSVKFAPDGNTLLSASDDQTLRWWQVSDGSPQRTLAEGMAGIRAVAISPDGQTVAIGGRDGQVRLLRFSNGELLRALPGHTDWIRCLAFSPDGQTLASGAFDATARLWRVSDGAPLFQLSVHTFSVLSVAFAPDGQTLATGSVDNTIGLWRVADGRLLDVLSGHTGFVFSVAHAADGLTLASGAADNTVRFWPMSPERVNTPLVEPPGMPPGAGCLECHHPTGDFLRPGGIAVAPRVVDVACAACHENGSLGLHWCPAFPPAPGVTELDGSRDNLSDQVGFPHASGDFAVALTAPGNGEHIYVSPIHTLLPVSGRLLGDQVADAEVGLEVWSGGERVGETTTTTDTDGYFYFTTDPHPDGIVLEVPIEKHDCVMCHSEPLHQSPFLPPGAVRLVVSAVSPDGQTASDERWITVDRSQTATAQVTVVAEKATTALPPLTVQANTRLYGWRGRTLTGATDADGVARFQVEVLTETATEYVIELPPTIIDGRRFTSVAPVTVTLPAGATEVPPVTLTVRSELGHISGQLLNHTERVTIHAIQLPTGTRYETASNASGTFEFAEMPLGPYLLLADAQGLAAQGLSSPPLRLDLTQSLQAHVSLKTESLREGGLRGVVLDDHGGQLPFAWVSAGSNGTASSTSPESGAWSLAGPNAGSPRSLVASAPGYYSQAIAQRAAAPEEEVVFTLRARPDLRRVAWGAGELVIPPESRLAASNGSAFSLEAGWLWGEGGAAQPLQIEVAGVVLNIQEGRFAVASVPGEQAWFYLLAGRARAYRTGQPSSAADLSAPAMLALPDGGDLVPVPLDPLVIRALQPVADPLPAVWEPSPAARLRNQAALLGISAAQVVTFITYMTVLLALFTVPLVRVTLWLRQARKARTPTDD